MKNKKITIEAAPYAYYSKVLQKPFDTIEELLSAESAYELKKQLDEDEAKKKELEAKEKEFAKIEAEDKVKKAFKNLNAAKDQHVKDIDAVATHYKEALDNLQKDFQRDVERFNNKLEKAEQAYDEALKNYEEKHPEGYHLVLKDGDNETVISKNAVIKKDEDFLYTPLVGLDELFSLFFGRNEK